MPILLMLLLSCLPEDGAAPTPPEGDPSARWVPLSESDLGADETGKDSGSEYPLCGPEVVLGASCEGDWTTTTCQDEDGAFWWCEKGSWQSGK